MEMYSFQKALHQNKLKTNKQIALKTLQILVLHSRSQMKNVEYILLIKKLKSIKLDLYINWSKIKTRRIAHFSIQYKKFYLDSNWPKIKT
jgi:hypothetical protein